MSSILSYSTILKDREKFRKAGTSHSDNFNLLDFPGQKFFKIFFYFNNGDSESAAGRTADSVGLLAPTWNVVGVNNANYYQYNSAWAYLKMNYEDERAENLKRFVNLLSNISSESPWYFTEISGLDAAIERKQLSGKEFIVEEQRSKISIKCLPDAFDDRIGTLLDLYRSVVWSWVTKREVLPANLRKFDMGIFLYEAPTIPFHKMKKNSLVDLGILNSYEYGELGDGYDYKTSYKYFEFHNCEIDYNSSKGNLSSIGNTEGLFPEYTIDILFDDCFESRYNESMLREIGDFIKWDIMSNLNILPETDNVTFGKNELNNRIGYFDPGFLKNAIQQVAGTGSNIAQGFINKSLLGNLYTFSFTKMMNQAQSVLNGDVWSTTRNVMEYVNDANQRKENNTTVNMFGRLKSKTVDSNGIPINNLNDTSETINSQPQTNNIFPSKRIIPRIQKLGNLATSNTIANNI